MELNIRLQGQMKTCMQIIGWEREGCGVCVCVGKQSPKDRMWKIRFPYRHASQSTFNVYFLHLNNLNIRYSQNNSGADIFLLLYSDTGLFGKIFGYGVS